MGSSDLSYSEGLKGRTLKFAKFMKGLTDRQRAFVAEYTIDYNSARAAKAVGYKNPAQGRKLTDAKYFPKVVKAIGEIQRQNLEDAILSKDEIVQELSLIAMRDPLEMCDEDGVIRLDDLRKIPAHIRRAIDSIKCTEKPDGTRSYEVRLVAKAQAFRMLMEHFGMFNHDQNVNLNADGAIPWVELFNNAKTKDNVIEGKLAEVRKLPKPKPKKRSKKREA